MLSLTPTIWMDHNAEEVTAFWCGIVPDSHVDNVVRSPSDNPAMKEGAVLVVEFTLAGRKWTALNGGPDFPPTEYLSLSITAKDQAEVDHYHAALTDGGGTDAPCGWLKDRYGHSWQVVPQRLYELMSDPDPDRARRATEAMLKQHGKLDIAAIEAAAA